MSHPNIHNPNMSRERMIELRENFTDYITGVLPIPEKYLETDTERKFANGDPTREMYEAYKLGPRSVDPKNLTPEKDRLIKNKNKSVLQVSTS